MKNKEQRVGHAPTAQHWLVLNTLPSLCPLLSKSSTSGACAPTQRLETFIFLTIQKTNIILLYILNTRALSRSYPHSKIQACS